MSSKYKTQAELHIRNELNNQFQTDLGMNNLTSDLHKRLLIKLSPLDTRFLWLKSIRDEPRQQIIHKTDTPTVPRMLDLGCVF